MKYVVNILVFACSYLSEGSDLFRVEIADKSNSNISDLFTPVCEFIGFCFSVILIINDINVINILIYYIVHISDALSVV